MSSNGFAAIVVIVIVLEKLPWRSSSNIPRRPSALAMAMFDVDADSNQRKQTQTQA